MRDTRHLRYSTHEFKPEQSKYAVVIPVINEGDRIHALLDRMAALDIPSLYDVVVVDGGSTDGSVDVENLKSRGVNSLLIKQSEGALGTQLQCAYDFALKRRYAGVVTIDGNNKDNPATIFSMQSALEDGVDFAQASRFIKGGKHLNTPLSRLIAVRFIHSTLISFSSGFHWTDTTQGFRAYSRQLIEDPALSLFRPELWDYALLFHISNAAPSLGFRCREVPSERNYPRGTTIPTKISGFRAWVRLGKVLLLVIFGHYEARKR